MLIPSGLEHSSTTSVNQCLTDCFIKLTLLHSEGPKLHRVLAVLCAIGLRGISDDNPK